MLLLLFAATKWTAPDQTRARISGPAWSAPSLTVRGSGVWTATTNATTRTA